MRQDRGEQIAAIYGPRTFEATIRIPEMKTFRLYIPERGNNWSGILAYTVR